MIDPITLHILQEQGMIEGYCLKCALCGRVVEIVKDGEGIMSCCNKRMFIMSGSPEPATEQNIFEMIIIEKIVLNKAANKFKRLDELEDKIELNEEELDELKKTKSFIGRAAATFLDPAYKQRKKDLMTLRKKTPGWYRKQLKTGYEKLAKKKPGLATRVAKSAGFKKGFDKIKAAQARRDTARRLGGYYKTSQMATQAAEKRAREKAKEKKQEKSMWKKEKTARKSMLKKQIKHLKKYGTMPKPKRKSKEIKGYGGGGISSSTASKKGKVINPAAWMGAESVNLELDKLFGECEADFGPYDQADAQKKVEKERDKYEKKVSEATDKDKLVKDIARQVATTGPAEKRGKEYRKKMGKRFAKTTLGMYGSQKRKKSHGYSESEELENIVGEIAEAEGMKGLPKGWTQDSLKKFSKSLTGKEGTKEGFFKKCVKKMEGKVDNPEGFCASVKDELHGSTYWRGKGKSPQEAGKDVKQHKNVRRG